MSKNPNNSSRRTFLATSATLVAASGVGALPMAVKGSDIPPAVKPKDCSVSLFASAMSNIGIDPMRRAMSHDIKPLVPVGATILGPAITTKWEVGRGKTTSVDIKKYVFQPLDEAASGSIWVVAGGTNPLFSMFGDLIASACKRNRMAGAVTDNGCRDIAAIRDVEFPVFAKASIPFGPADFIRPVGANVPIVCGGVAVNPGDWVAADLDGVIVIPKNDLHKVIEAANVLLAKEEKVRSKIESGAALADAYKL